MTVYDRAHRAPHRQTPDGRCEPARARNASRSRPRRRERTSCGGAFRSMPG
jgi:hypothetical protein